MYDTVRLALQELRNDLVFERVAYWALESRYPGLRPTSPSSDLARDGYVRTPFSTGDEVVLWVSLQGRWQSKLEFELRQHRRHDRRAKAVFTTTRTTTEASKEQWRKLARAEHGVELEIVDLHELTGLLEHEGLRWVGEVELGVRPQAPRALTPAGSYLQRLAHRVPGMTQPLVDGAAFAQQLHNALTGSERVVVVEGHGGIGKTRQVIEAALTVAATLVLATGAPLERSSFTEVPLDVPSVLVVDDAHRCPGLAPLALLLADPRFDPVRVVLVVRPGHGDAVRHRAGVESHPTRTLRLEPLDSRAVDRIVTGHGIRGESFRRRVVELADGNPLLAHTACDVATASGRFSWTDTSHLLSELVRNRLGGDGPATRELRATAVALAVRGHAGDARGHGAGRDLATLTGAVTALPADPGRLDLLLADLADAGLAAGPPYTLRPHLAAPVILAQAMRRDQAVRLDVDAALQILAEDAGRFPLFGEGLSWAEVYLGPQLTDLTVAVRDSADTGLARTLAGFVRSLLPARADHDDWSVVVALADRIVPAVPTVLTDLHTALVAQWPPAEEPDGEDLQWLDHWRNETSGLARRYTDLAAHVDEAEQPGAVSALLDLAYLCDTAGPDLVPLREIAQWRVSAGLLAPGRCNDLMALRRERLHTITQWGRDRIAEPPTGLSAYQARRRGPATIARVLLAALTPLLSGSVRITTPGTPQDEIYHVREVPLPAHPDLPLQVEEAAGALVALLDQSDLHRQDNLPVLQALVAVAGALRKEAVRPLLGGRELPEHARKALIDAAATASAGIAARWESLPPAVRRHAVEGVLLLAAVLRDRRAAAGDPVTAAALRHAAPPRQPAH
ncbi:hypothetical protein [Kitasatospora sp. NPDC098663]|uniref:hypothetical protein n=1 Tax=Kitasatospora sp. NPDC098663 TaxID=3364096 RepID=UPI0037FB42D9